MQDAQIIEGIVRNNDQRPYFENELYKQYKYFIDEGCRKYRLDYDDGFSAYSDAVLSVINNILNNSFHHKSSLKTYLFQIFSNKCIDFIRKKTTNKQSVNHPVVEPDLLGFLPDGAKSIIEKLIDDQKIQTVKEQIKTLGEKCKDILLLYEDGYSDKEIAEQLNYNTAAVAKTTRLRCLEKIKEKIKNLFI